MFAPKTDPSSSQPYCVTRPSTAEQTQLLQSLSIVSLGKLTLPLCCKKPEKVYDIGQGDPNAILRFRP